MYGSKNKYEVQIDNADRALKGVTYSYQNTTFYGKASLIGMWTPGTNNLIFKEDKLLEYRMTNGDDGSVYMFTCYLEYRREGDKEILEGNYTSQHYKNGTDGGSGKIYLEKVPSSDFKKEDFIIKKEKQDSIKARKPAPPIAKQPTAPKQNVVKAPPVKKPATTPTQKPASKPNQEVAKAPVTKKPTTPAPSTKPADKEAPATVKVAPPVEKKIIELPPVLKERKNDLVRTIVTSASEIEVNLYDNGEIDGDTISVFLNGRQIAAHQGLSTRPITLKIKLDDANPDQEITMVAENLGSIPPNTALMLVNAGSQRFDLRISSSDKNNAVVRFHYQSAGGANK
jgi:hypothetical protein